MEYSQDPFGKFSVTLKPNTAEVEVGVKLFWEFDSAYSEKEQTDYQTAALRNILRVWDKVRGFRATSGSNSGLLVKPTFVIEEADTEDDAHFLFTVRKGNAPGRLIPKASKVEIFEYDAWTKQELLNSGDQVKVGVGKGAVSNLNGLAVGAARRMEELLAVFNNEITLNRTSQETQTWEVSTGSKAALRTFVGALSSWPSRLARPAVTISTSSGAEGKAAAQADAVKNYIESLNPPGDQIFRVDAVKTKAKTKLNIFRSHAKTGVARLGHEDELALIGGNRVSNEYCVAAHEFGHCLGLPDEYTNSSPEADTTWRQLLNRAGLGDGPARNRDNGIATSETSCIMHNGIVVEKRHMVTIWAALKAATSANWTIE